MGIKIASTFRGTLADALAALPQPTIEPGQTYITAQQLQSCMGPEGAAGIRAIADDLVAVIAEIQRYRDNHPGADRYFRERGIVTRARRTR